MYTSGHLEILDAALALVPDFNSPEDIMNLRAALSYPDFPCGKVSVVQEGDGSQVLREDMSNCSLSRMALSLLFKKLSFVYQSHNGFYAFWHAMSIDPDLSVANVAKNICEYVLICCRLAFVRRSMFWLGFALHILMDAYSPAHVLRELPQVYLISKSSPQHQKSEAARLRDLPTYVQLHDAKLGHRARRRIGRMRSIIEHVVRGTSEGRPFLDILKDQPPPYRNLTAFILFDHLQRQELPFRTTFDSPSIHRSGDGQAWKSPRIMNFYYYPKQSAFFHAMKDRLAAVRAAGLWEPCVQDAATLLKLYMDSINSLNPPNSQSEFLRGVYDLMRTRTLALHPDCIHAETGFPISTFMGSRAKKILLTRSLESTAAGTFFTHAKSGAQISVHGDVFVIPVGSAKSAAFRFTDHDSTHPGGGGRVELIEYRYLKVPPNRMPVSLALYGLNSSSSLQASLKTNPKSGLKSLDHIVTLSGPRLVQA
jgi:hypothetical protein